MKFMIRNFIVIMRRCSCRCYEGKELSEVLFVFYMCVFKLKKKKVFLRESLGIKVEISKKLLEILGKS